MDAARELQLRDVKTSLSNVLDEARQGTPTVITRRRKPQGVLLGYEEYQRLSKVPSLGWLLANSPLDEGDLSEDRRPARSLPDL